MSKKAATEDKLGQLHNKLADLFLEALEGETVLDAKGEQVLVTPSPQLINAARAFLKDNDIVCIPSEDNRVGALGGKLQALRKDAKERFKDGESTSPDNVTPLRVAE